MRRVGVAEDGSWVGDQISQTSETRTFSWQ
jgi:hypothetical protein